MMVRRSRVCLGMKRKNQEENSRWLFWGNTMVPSSHPHLGPHLHSCIPEPTAHRDSTGLGLPSSLLFHVLLPCGDPVSQGPPAVGMMPRCPGIPLLSERFPGPRGHGCVWNSLLIPSVLLTANLLRCLKVRFFSHLSTRQTPSSPLTFQCGGNQRRAW